MPFSIKFVGKNSINESLGEIISDGLDETIVIPTDFWSEDTYERQWKEAIERVSVSEGDIASMLLTSMHDPKGANYLECWPIYKVDGSVYLRNSLIFINESNNSINEQNLYNFVPPRETVSEDTGESISEWELNPKDLRDWLSSSMENS